MKKSVMKKWVKSLKSRKYKKCTGVLKSKDKYCSLGVLCEISGISNFDENDDYLKHSTSLPTKVKDYAKIQNEFIISKFNDIGKSFNWIANYIEKNYKKL